MLTVAWRHSVGNELLISFDCEVSSSTTTTNRRRKATYILYCTKNPKLFTFHRECHFASKRLKKAIESSAEFS